MNFNFKVLFTLLLAACFFTLSLGQAGHKPTRVVKSPIELERLIFKDCKLSPSQNERAERLLQKFDTQLKAQNGLLGPPDRRVVMGLSKQYRDGLKQVLTPQQFKRYMGIHVAIARKLAQRRQMAQGRRGMHF